MLGDLDPYQPPATRLERPDPAESDSDSVAGALRRRNFGHEAAFRALGAIHYGSAGIDIVLVAIALSTGFAGAQPFWPSLTHDERVDWAALSLATFVIGLRQPRGPIRRLATDPGFVAMSVVVMTTVYYTVHLTMRVIASYYSKPPLFSTHIVWFLSNMFYSLGWNIAIAWFLLALQGKWRFRAIGNGKLAAALGFTWVAIWILTDLRQFARMIYINYF